MSDDITLQQQWQTQYRWWASEFDWECPYCGNRLTEEQARYAGCCGEAHCYEVKDANQRSD